MGYKLFLDDVRIPCHCVTYMHSRIGARNPIYLERGWVICKNYHCFTATIEDMGLPDFISFDHDLAEEHYIKEWSEEWLNPHHEGEMTGYNCAQWLIWWCTKHDLEIPDFTVHSMNPVGTERIFSLLNQAKRYEDDRKRV